METRIRLLIMSADARVRRGLAMRLASEPDLAVVGQAPDVTVAIAVASTLQLSVVVLDLGSRNASGCIDVEPIRRLAPAHRVVALAIDDSHRLRERAFKAGAAALVAKQGDPDELLAAIRGVASTDGPRVSP